MTLSHVRKQMKIKRKKFNYKKKDSPEHNYFSVAITSGSCRNCTRCNFIVDIFFISVHCNYALFFRGLLNISFMLEYFYYSIPYNCTLGQNSQKTNINFSTCDEQREYVSIRYIYCNVISDLKCKHQFIA